MKINQKLIEKYNHQDSLMIVSVYPKKGEVYSSGVSGVASYVKNLASNLNRKVIVIADYQANPEIYEEGNVLVARCFKVGKMGLWRDVYKILKQFKQVKTALMQLAPSIYGGWLISGLILPFIAILRLVGYRVSVSLHHVVEDIGRLSGHVGLGNSELDSLKIKFINLVFKIYYWSLGWSVNKIIVLEQGLQSKLAKLVDKNKGEISIVSEDHDAGKKLHGLGGIGAILRYKLNY